MPEVGQIPTRYKILVVRIVQTNHVLLPEGIEKFRVDVIEDGIVQGGKAEALLPWVLYLWQVRLFGFPLSVEDPIPVPNPTVDANGRSSFSPAAAEG